EAAPRDVRHQLVAIAEVPIRRRRADAGPARGFSKGEARGPFFGDQFERGTHQGLLQIAVVIPALAAAALPVHVKSIYITATWPSMVNRRPYPDRPSSRREAASESGAPCRQTQRQRGPSPRSASRRRA